MTGKSPDKPDAEHPRTAADMLAGEPFAVFRKFSSKRPLTDDEEAEIQRQIADDPDDQELTEERASQRMTFAEAFPDLAASIKRGDRDGTAGV